MIMTNLILPADHLNVFPGKLSLRHDNKHAVDETEWRIEIVFLCIVISVVVIVLIITFITWNICWGIKKRYFEGK